MNTWKSWRTEAERWNAERDHRRRPITHADRLLFQGRLLAALWKYRRELYSTFEKALRGPLICGRCTAEGALRTAFAAPCKCVVMLCDTCRDKGDRDAWLASYSRYHLRTLRPYCCQWGGEGPETLEAVPAAARTPLPHALRGADLYITLMRRSWPR